MIYDKTPKWTAHQLIADFDYKMNSVLRGGQPYFGLMIEFDKTDPKTLVLIESWVKTQIALGRIPKYDGSADGKTIQLFWEKTDV